MAADNAPVDINTDNIKDWRSIVTLIVFVLTNINVLFPFHVPIYVPRFVANAFLDLLSALRIIAPRPEKLHLRQQQQPQAIVDGSHGRRHQDAASSQQKSSDSDTKENVNSLSSSPANPPRFVKILFPMDFVTAPIIADLFLLAILAIGREEVKGGTVGTNNIVPYDIMIFFLTLAYIAISVDASGLIRYLAFRVLQWGGEVGHRLFFYLYAFFFVVGGFIGNDPIILSGTAFLAYMTRVSSNIVHPRAWIHTQFAIANIASAILVSSNPTNLVLAGAFKIRFIDYTVNMIVPVVVTAIVLFPFLLYVVFNNESLIPAKIEMHQLSEEAKARQPVNPNIPNARGSAADQEEQAASNTEEGKLLSLEEILNPFLDKSGAAFGGIIMAATLVTVLVLNAVSTGHGEYPVFWVTLPASVVMFTWDLAMGWLSREKTREIARRGRREVQEARDRRAMAVEDGGEREQEMSQVVETGDAGVKMAGSDIELESITPMDQAQKQEPSTPALVISEPGISPMPQQEGASTRGRSPAGQQIHDEPRLDNETAMVSPRQPTTLVSLGADAYRWCQETFPTTTAVITHLPFALVPFAFAMFVLVQALVTKGWVPVFAWGWEHWVDKTGVVGAIGGMGFLSVILCNFAGTNIGTTILLSRVIQAWEEIHRQNPDLPPIDNRTFWATVYSMALGVNYGAFSTAFSASLAGMLWRDILLRKHIRVRSLDFTRVNIPIITIAMAVGCAVLVGQVYITRNTMPYQLGSTD